MSTLKGSPSDNPSTFGELPSSYSNIKIHIREEKPLLSGKLHPDELMELEYSIDSPFPRHYKGFDWQRERVRSALVVYATHVLEQLKIESTPDIMQTCLEVGEEMYKLYSFEQHGPYTQYIEGHLRRAISEKGYALKVASQIYFG